MDTDTDLLEWVKTQLHQRRGQWRQISERSEVPYFTLSKIASGATADPRWQTLSRLADELRRGEAA